MALIPLFPLNTVLFPGAILPIQIFEPRYLDLVKECLRNDTGFGVVLIREGEEVAAPGRPTPAIYATGCYARIIDWDGLPHGRLGLKIEGEKKFRLLSSEILPNQLMMAEVEFLAVEDDFMVTDNDAVLVSVLSNLLEHPVIKQLGLSVDTSSATQLSSLLAQLLPIEEKDKQLLLEIFDPERRLEAISESMQELGG